LVAIAVLLVIGVTIGATLLITRDGDGPSTPPTSDVPSDIASANDTGPVSIITEEPTCKGFNAINNALADVAQNGWGSARSTLGPAADWTADQRQQTEAVATAMRNAARQTVGLAKQTPHRLVRELYEQYIAYGRAYADSLPAYTPADDSLASVTVNAGAALIAICNSITYESTGRALAIEEADAPSSNQTATNIEDPPEFISDQSPTCTAWVNRDRRFSDETKDWAALDTSIDGAQWTPEQKTIQLSTLPKLSAWASDMEALGRQSNNPVMEDFALAAGLYLRAYVTGGETYVMADSYLTTTAFRLSNTIAAACEAVMG
jgi:hypothetical protein